MKYQSMSRRRFLSKLLTGLSLTVVGCLETETNSSNCDGSPTIDANSLALEPGEQAVVQIMATNVIQLSISGVGTPIDNNFEINIGEPSPAPDEIAGSYPPEWFWSDCTDVKLDLRVQANEEAQPGEYRYTVIAGQSSKENGASISREFTIKIAEYTT